MNLNKIPYDNNDGLIGSPIDIRSYTSSSPYIAPSDGYIRYRVRQGETGGFEIRSSDGNSSNYIWIHITPTNDTRGGLFVKQGIQIYNNGAYQLDFLGV